MGEKMDFRKKKERFDSLIVHLKCDIEPIAKEFDEEHSRFLTARKEGFKDLNVYREFNGILGDLRYLARELPRKYGVSIPVSSEDELHAHVLKVYNGLVTLRRVLKEIKEEKRGTLPYVWPKDPKTAEKYYKRVDETLRDFMDLFSAVFKEELEKRLKR